MKREKPGRCRFYPLISIVWNTDLGISATKPSNDSNYPELLFSYAGHYLAMGPNNGRELLSVSFDTIAVDKNISVKNHCEDTPCFEGNTEAAINKILAVPNGHILCLEEDHVLREYGPVSGAENKIELLTSVAEDVKQLYSLPHPMLLTMDQRGEDNVHEVRDRLCLGACIADMCLEAIILVENAQIALSRVTSLKKYIDNNSDPTIVSCITSSGRLFFGVFQSPGTLLVVEACDSTAPTKYDLSQIFTDKLLDDGISYSDPKEIALLGLFDGKFAILACYTNEYNTIVVIYNVVEEKIEFKTTIMQYVVCCTVTPYCPTSCTFFFNMKFLNMENIVSLDFFYFSYASRDNYSEILKRLNSYLDEKNGSSNDFVNILVDSCNAFFQHIAASRNYDDIFIPLLDNSELFGMMDNARFSKVKCLSEVDKNIFVSPHDIIISSPVISSVPATVNNLIIPGSKCNDCFIKSETIAIGNTAEWNYSPLALEIRDKIKELVTSRCEACDIKFTLSELAPFHLDSPSHGYDKIYANLAFSHLGGTNQVVIYIETISRVYVSDFLPLYILQPDIRNCQDGNRCISSLKLLEDVEIADQDVCAPLDDISQEIQAFPTDGASPTDKPTSEPDPIHGEDNCLEEVDMQKSICEPNLEEKSECESIDDRIPPKIGSPESPFQHDDNSSPQKSGLVDLEAELDRQINKKIEDAKEKYDRELNERIDAYANKETITLFLDSALPNYFASELSYLSIMKQLNQLRGIRILLEGKCVDGHSLSKQFLKSFYAMKRQNMFPFPTPMIGSDFLTFSTVTMKDINSSSCYRLSSVQTRNRISNENIIEEMRRFCSTMEATLATYESQIDVFQLGYRFYWNMNELLKMLKTKEPHFNDSTDGGASLHKPSTSTPQNSVIFGSVADRSHTNNFQNNPADPLDLSSYEDVPTEDIKPTQSRISNLDFPSLSNTMDYKSSYTGHVGMVKSSFLNSAALSQQSIGPLERTYEDDPKMSIANKFRASHIDDVFRKCGSSITMRMSVKQQNIPKTQRSNHIPPGSSLISSKSVEGVDEVDSTIASSSSSKKKLPNKRSSIFQRLSNVTPTFKRADGECYSNIITVAFKSDICNNTGDTNASVTSVCNEHQNNVHLETLVKNLMPPPSLENVLPEIKESTLCITDLFTSHSFEIIVEQSKQLSGGNVVVNKDSVHKSIENISQTIFRTENALPGPKTCFNFSLAIDRPAEQPQSATDTTQQKSVVPEMKPFAFAPPTTTQPAEQPFLFGLKVEQNNTVKEEKLSDDKLEPPSDKDKVEAAPIVPTSITTDPSPAPPAPSDIAPDEQKPLEPDPKPTAEANEKQVDEPKKETASTGTLSTGFNFNVSNPFVVQDKGSTSKGFGFGFPTATSATADSKPPSLFGVFGGQNTMAKQESNDNNSTNSNSIAKPNPDQSTLSTDAFVFGAPKEPPKAPEATATANTNTGFGINTNFGFDAVTINPNPQANTQMTAPVTTFQNTFSLQGPFGQGTQQAAPTAKMFNIPSSGVTTNAVFGNTSFSANSNPFGSGTAPISFSFGSASNK